MINNTIWPLQIVKRLLYINISYLSTNQEEGLGCALGATTHTALANRKGYNNLFMVIIKIISLIFNKYSAYYLYTQIYQFYWRRNNILEKYQTLSVFIIISMATTLQKFRSLLPVDQSQESNSKRSSVWEKWDTNQHGFMKLAEIEDGLLRLFDFATPANIKLVILKASQTTRQTLQVKSAFGADYIQKKQFRVFLNALDQHLEKMLIFEHFDTNKDNKIEKQDLNKVSKVFQKWSLDDQKVVEISQLASNNELNLNNFMEWISSVPYYSLNDIK